MKLVYQPPFTMNFDCAHILLLKTIKLTLVIYLFINLCIEIFIRYEKNEFCLLTKYPLVYDFSILGDARPAQLHCPIFFLYGLIYYISYIFFSAIHLDREKRQLVTCPGFPGYCSESYPGGVCTVVCAFGRPNVPECQV